MRIATKYALIPLLFTWALTLSACSEARDFALQEYAPKSPQAAIKEVSLGTSDSDNFDPARVATRFPAGTKKVLVWYRWEGANKDTKVAIRWSWEGNTVLEQGEAFGKPAGSAAWVLKMGAGGDLPPGKYQVELFENETSVTAIPFQVGEVEAAATPSSSAAASGTPWASRGWREEAQGAYVNDEHDLRLSVPPGWTVGDENKFSARYLWLMAKLGPNGEERLVVNIARREDVQDQSTEEVFKSELEGLKQATLTINGKTAPLTSIRHAGKTAKPDVYEIAHTLVHDGSRSHQLIFVRNDTGYLVTRKAAADASDAEIVELEEIRRSMGL